MTISRCHQWEETARSGRWQSIRCRLCGATAQKCDGSIAEYDYPATYSAAELERHRRWLAVRWGGDER